VGVLVVVISGPIASGKSRLGRAVAEELESRHLSAAVVDLDLVYEMLDPRREPKSDQERWRSARRAAGLIVHTLLAERCAVVVEGDFMTAQKRVDFCQGLPDGVRTRFVTLRVAFDEALRRAQADPTRGISKDPDFLAAQYEQAQVAARRCARHRSEGRHRNCVGCRGISRDRGLGGTRTGDVTHELAETRLGQRS
jgi:shikimate kinase